MTAGVFYNNNTQSYQQTWNLVDDPDAVRARGGVKRQWDSLGYAQKCCVISTSVITFSAVALIIQATGDCSDSYQEENNAFCSDGVTAAGAIGVALGIIGSIGSAIVCCVKS